LSTKLPGLLTCLSTKLPGLLAGLLTKLAGLLPGLLTCFSNFHSRASNNVSQLFNYLSKHLYKVSQRHTRAARYISKSAAKLFAKLSNLLTCLLTKLAGLLSDAS
jgi:hypothetical protein